MKEIKDKDFNRIKKTIEQLYDYHAAVDDLESMRDCEEETVFSEITLKLKKIVECLIS